MPLDLSDNTTAGLDRARSRAIAAIDAAAARAQTRYATTLPMQPHVYSAKLAEANRLLNALPGTVTPSSTPWLAREASALGVSRRRVAEDVRAAAQATDTPLQDVEDIRRPAKVAVRAAVTHAEIAQARFAAAHAIDAL